MKKVICIILCLFSLPALAVNALFDNGRDFKINLNSDRVLVTFKGEDLRCTKPSVAVSRGDSGAEYHYDTYHCNGNKNIELGDDSSSDYFTLRLFDRSSGKLLHYERLTGKAFTPVEE